MNILHFKPSESKTLRNYPYLLKQTNHKDEENPYSTILPLANEYEKFVYSLTDTFNRVFFSASTFSPLCSFTVKSIS